MARFAHTVTLARPPAEAFPWLFEADKVPQWTSDLEAYEMLDSGSLAAGSRVRQVLKVSSERIDLTLEITRYEPPTAAESRFSISGLEVVTQYELAEADGGSSLTQTLEGKASGFKARLLVPVVQPRLERKLTADLERLRELLAR